jgi:hypothetical protein
MPHLSQIVGRDVVDDDLVKEQFWIAATLYAVEARPQKVRREVVCVAPRTRFLRPESGSPIERRITMPRKNGGVPSVAKRPGPARPGAAR